MKINNSFHHDGALSPEVIQKIEATTLPNLDKHHLRLLAYSLVSLQSMSNNDSNKTGFPEKSTRLKWCANHQRLRNEQSFIPLFLEQLEVAEQFLEKVAKHYQINPLEITVDDLIAFRMGQDA